MISRAISARTASPPLSSPAIAPDLTLRFASRKKPKAFPPDRVGFGIKSRTGNRNKVACLLDPLTVRKLKGMTRGSTSVVGPFGVVSQEGYSGVFTLIKDSQHGIASVIKDGAWTFEMPGDGANGRLHVQSQ